MRLCFIQGKKKGALAPFSRYCGNLLTVTLTELVDLFCGLQDVLFTGVEGVRLTRNLEFEQWVLITVFPGDGLSGRHGGFCQDRKIGRDILEHNVSVIWVNVLFHDATSMGRALKGANFDLLVGKVQVFFSWF